LIKKIYISWRKKPGEPRFLIAVLKRTSAAKRLSFAYEKDFEAAQKEGMDELFGFGKQADSLKSASLEKLIALRTISKDKADRNEILDFWGISPTKSIDNFDMLARTQGKSPTDNLEFLADFSLKRRK
jgi:hypothetical protein